MSAAIIIMMVLSAAMGAYTAIQTGKAQKRASQQNALIAQNQAEWAEYNAQQEAAALKEQAEWNEYNATLAEQEAEKAAKAKGEEYDRLLATQAARYGKAGVTLEGTPLTVMAGTARSAEEDIDSLLYEGAVEAWNWRMRGRTRAQAAEASLLEGSAASSANLGRSALYTARGAAAQRAGYYQAGSTILTGATKASQYYNEGA